MRLRTLSAVGGTVAVALVLSACAGVSGNGTPSSPPAPVTVTARVTVTAPVTRTVTSTAKVTVTATKRIPAPVPPAVTKTATVTQTQTETETETQTSTPHPGAEISAGMSDAEIRTKTASAMNVVQTYWTDLFSTWKDHAGKPISWWRPSLWNGDGFFDSTAGQDASCGADVNNADNAFFCPDPTTGTGYMAWDMDFFRQHAYLGDAVIYMVVAHETAHAAQTRFKYDGEAPAVLSQYELQADCIGGATLAKAAKDGYLTIDDGALQDMTNVSAAIGDYSGDIHGTPEQRDAWFKKGYHGDIESCLGHR